MSNSTRKDFEKELQRITGAPQPVVSLLTERLIDLVREIIIKSQ